VPALHLGDHAVEHAVAKLAALQGGGNISEKCITIGDGQRPGGGHDGGQLLIGERDRCHQALPLRRLPAAAIAASGSGCHFDTPAFNIRR
jgi:hypothetical protein